MSLRRRLILAAGLAVGFPAAAAGQTAYPAGKPIKAIVPFAAGSATDIIARVYTDGMSRVLGSSIVVENRAGANGMIGAGAVAKADPDGFTLLVGTNSTNAAAPALFNNVPFDHEKDFAPISFLGSIPLIVGVPASYDAKTLKDLIAKAKAAPGKLNYASASTSQRVSTEMLASMTGIKLTVVPYRASPQAVQDLIAGRIDLFTADLAVMLPQVQAGGVRALAVTSAGRVPQLPDVPTVDEAAGTKGYELIAWFGLFAPARTPVDVIVKLNDAVRKSAGGADVQEKLGKGMGLAVATSSPAELAARVKVESAKWAKAVADAGIEKQ
jgi:tripartite-type tricarboxylate transporter receptor subunit TctC